MAPKDLFNKDEVRGVTGSNKVGREVPQMDRVLIHSGIGGKGPGLPSLPKKKPHDKKPPPTTPLKHPQEPGPSGSTPYDPYDPNRPISYAASRNKVGLPTFNVYKPERAPTPNSFTISARSSIPAVSVPGGGLNNPSRQGPQVHVRDAASDFSSLNNPSRGKNKGTKPKIEKDYGKNGGVQSLSSSFEEFIPAKEAKRLKGLEDKSLEDDVSPISSFSFGSKKSFPSFNSGELPSEARDIESSSQEIAARTQSSYYSELPSEEIKTQDWDKSSNFSSFSSYSSEAFDGRPNNAPILEVDKTKGPSSFEFIKKPELSKESISEFDPSEDEFDKKKPKFKIHGGF